jgi:hypothetical protein
LKLLVSQSYSVPCYFLTGPNSVPSIVFSNKPQSEMICHYIHKTRGHITLQLHPEDQRCHRSLNVFLSLCSDIMYENIWNGKGKAKGEGRGKGKVIFWLISFWIMPWRHTEDWWYGTTNFNFDPRWTWVASLMLLSFYPPEIATHTH